MRPRGNCGQWFAIRSELVRELGKDRKDTMLTDAFFAGYLEPIANAIAIAKAYAPLHVVRHLTSDRMKKAFG